MSNPETPDRDPSAQRFASTVNLIRRAKVGDEDAFTDLYLRHADRVRRSAEWELGSQCAGRHHELDDVVMEAFDYAFRQLREGSFDEEQTEGGFRRYLAKIVVNKARDHTRKRLAAKRGSGRVRLMADVRASSLGELDFLSPAARPSQVAQANELEDRIGQAVQKLRDLHRRVLDLRDNCQMSYEEMAARMGYTNWTTVRSLYFRARACLRKLVGEGTVAG